jgi:hypothetical protein
MSGTNSKLLITLRTPSPQWSMVVAASFCGDVFHRQRLGNWSELKEWGIWYWDGGTPSSRIMTLSILVKQHKWFKGKHVNVLEWPTQSPDVSPIENLWYDLNIAVHQRNPSILKELDQFGLEWEKIPVARCAKRHTQETCSCNCCKRCKRWLYKVLAVLSWWKMLGMLGMWMEIFGGLPKPGFRHGKDIRVGGVC